MSTQTPTTQAPGKDLPPIKNPKGLLPALVAAVVVAVVAFGVFLVNRDGIDLANATPVEIASAYMDARNAFDADRAAELLAPDATLNDMPIIGVDELELGFEMLSLYEFNYSPYECTETSSGGQSGLTTVVCTYMMNTRLSEIVGYPPVDGSTNFTIENGRVRRFTQAFNFSEFGPNVYDKFLLWLEGAHADGFDQLFRLEGNVATPRLTRESLDLLPGYLDEFDQSING